MVILKSQSQVRSFIKRHKLNYKNSRGTDGCNVWGVKYNVLQFENKVIKTELIYCSGERDWHTYSVLAIIKIKFQ
jgi:hypothetical protein